MNMCVVKLYVIAEINVNISSGTLQLWHERLRDQAQDHMYSVLKRLGIETESRGYELCDVCALGKSHRKPFRTRSTRPTKLAEQISADVCGPLSVK